MNKADTIIIGGGQAGLAMSRCLTERGIDHVIFERGELGQRWRDERWDSLRLLSPNWMARLPHYRYDGENPDGYMTMPEFVRYLEDYAETFSPPLLTGTTVTLVERINPDSLRVVTNRGVWQCRRLTIATGFCDRPRIPEFADTLSPAIAQIVPSHYRNPGQLPDGNVLVVGASATGIQIADELAAAGRQVTLAVGTHVRLPRRYRGRDILCWMVEMGAFRAPADPAGERASPPPQLVGTPESRDLDLATLQAAGVRLVGHAVAADDSRFRFADDLAESLGSADTQLAGLLDKIDAYIAASDIDAPFTSRPSASLVPDAPTEIDLDTAGITCVIWATGYERHYPWLCLPILDKDGEIRHERGVTPDPDVVVLGMRFQRTKGSNLIDGVGSDAEDLAEYLAGNQSSRAAA